MPIFEYKCKQCGERFEIFRSSSNTDPAPCPKCKSEDTNKLISGFASTGSNYSNASSSTAANCGPSGFS